MKFFSLDNRAWLATTLNVVAMSDQLRVLIQAGPEGVRHTSLLMMVIFLFTQTTFAQVVHTAEQKHLKWGMALSAIVTATIVAYCVRHRWF